MLGWFAPESFDPRVVQWQFDVYRWLLENFGGYERFSPADPRYNELAPDGLSLTKPLRRAWMPLAALIAGAGLCRWSWRGRRARA